MSLKKQTISGVKWTTISTVVLMVVSLLKISILARFLDKSDFGLMALVTFVLGFMNLFVDMGLTSAILHKQQISKQEYASLYWINIIFSIFIIGVIYVVSPLISAFYDEPELTILIPLMSLSIIFSAVGQQYKTISQKELQFKYIAFVEILGGACGLAVGVVMAIKNFGVYSLIFGTLTQYFISNILFFLKGLFRGGLLFHFNYKETQLFLKIGLYQVGGQAINYINKDLDVLIFGKFFGMDLVGGYSLAKQLVFRPAQVINPIMTRVATPALSKIQNDIFSLKSNYLKLINVISSVNIPIYLCIIIFAQFIVLAFYGKEFSSIVPFVQLLSVIMIVRSLGNPVGSLIVATGRTDLEFKWNVFVTTIVPIVIFVGAQFSILTAVVFLTITRVILFVPAWKLLVNKLTGITLKEYLNNIFDFKFIFKILFMKKTAKPS